jgi:hypothetical protein
MLAMIGVDQARAARGAVFSLVGFAYAARSSGPDVS